MASHAAAPPKSDLRGTLYALGLISLVVALLGLGVAYAVDAASRSVRIAPHRLDDTTTLTRAVGGKTLRIPLAWFRDPEGGDDGFSKQVSLLFRLPIGPDRAIRPVDVTLVPRSTVRASARLLDGVYLHVFDDAEVVGEPGLVGKPLKDAEGYSTETVWYDPISANPFVAKCDDRSGPQGRSVCLRIVYLAPGLAAIYRFPVDALAGWREFDAELDGRLRQIGALDS
jgi:hypothetical protein